MPQPIQHWLIFFLPFSTICYLCIRSPLRDPTQLICLFLDSQAQQVHENFSQDKFLQEAQRREGPDELVLSLSFPIFRLAAFLGSDLKPCMTCIPLHAHHNAQMSAGQRMERVWDGERRSLQGKPFPRIVFFQGALSGISAGILQNMCISQEEKPPGQFSSESRADSQGHTLLTSCEDEAHT